MPGTKNSGLRWGETWRVYVICSCAMACVHASASVSADLRGMAWGMEDGMGLIAREHGEESKDGLGPDSYHELQQEWYDLHAALQVLSVRVTECSVHVRSFLIPCLRPWPCPLFLYCAHIFMCSLPPPIPCRHRTQVSRARRQMPGKPCYRRRASSELSSLRALHPYAWCLRACMLEQHAYH
jgi:hypothetical protein